MAYPFLDSRYFAHHGQRLIERTYLLEFKSLSKQDTHNGYVERILHGAEHAGRVSIYIPILHRLFQQHFPAYVKRSMTAIQRTLSYDENQLILLLRYVALCHDAARQNEGIDHWESESAEIAHLFLINNGVQDDHAQALAMLIVDRAYPPAELNKLDYFRILLALSDCFDAIRCVGIFDYKNVAAILDQVPGYSSIQHDEVFFDFAKSVYCLLKQMKDLYFPTSLRDASGKIHYYNEENAYFSMHKKVSFEQAPNVLIRLEKVMQQQPDFALYLPKMPTQILPTHDSFRPMIHGTHRHLDLSSPSPLPCAYIRYRLERTPFYPFIHGTNSRMLPLLVQTNFEIMGPLKLMRTYSLAPITGEISQGGLAGPGIDCKPAFALVQNKSHNGNPNYDVQSVINNYASARLLQDISAEKIVKNLTTSHCEAKQKLFYSINELMVNFTRVCQLGISYSATEELINELKQTIQLYYFYLLIAKYTQLNLPVNAILWILRLRAGFRWEKEPNFYFPTTTPLIKQTLKQYFTQEHLFALFHEKNIDFKALYNNYSQQAYQTVLDQLGFKLHGMSIFLPMDMPHEAKPTAWYPQQDRHDIILQANDDPGYSYSPYLMILNAKLN